MGSRSPVIVGRGNELRSIQQALNSARSDRGTAMFVVGEPGVGKSRLAMATADLAVAAGMRVLRGRGSPIGPIVPFRSLTEALMSLLRSGDPVDVSELGPYTPVLAKLIPDLGQPPMDKDGGSLIVLAEGVLRLTGLAGRERGCLLILDDLQDSDAETLAVVDYLTSNLDRQPTMILGAIRAEPCPALDLARSAAQRGCGVLLELRRLNVHDVRRLAAACLEDQAAAIPDQVVNHLWACSEGIPLLVEELLNGMRESGQLTRHAEGWRVAGPLRTKVPVTVARTVAERLDHIGAVTRELLSVAAILGRRFPLAVLQAASGLSHHQLLIHLQAGVAPQLVAPDEETPDWYAFQHPLIAESLVILLDPAERGRLAQQAAAAVEACYPSLPGEWCQTSATLHLQAGDPARAGRLFTQAGHRALAQGAASSAIALLDKALELLTSHDDAPERADAFATLLYALVEAGLVERAISLAGKIEQVNGLLTRESRAQLHTKLAWAAAVAGLSEDGMTQVSTARRLLGPNPSDEDTAPIDVVAAHLALDVPGRDQLRIAEGLARRAAEVAEKVPLPVIACQAWQLLGALSRPRDLDEATASLERARQIAVRYDLPIEEIHALIRLGNDDALRDGSLGRLEQARLEASRAGAITSRYQAESSIAFQAILRGDFATAKALIDQILAFTPRMQLIETTRYTILLRAILGAHRGRRHDMEDALAELHRWGDHAQHTPRIYGLAQAWCSLLEEKRSQALRELSLACTAEENSPTIFQLTGRYGLRLLLRTLDGRADREEYQATTAAPGSKLRWDRQFALLAHAVLCGRSGQATEAAKTVTEAMQVGAIYDTGRHIGLRLVSEAAIADGWGTPVEWLRASEEYFHAHGVPAVASACRALMRRAGATVTQRRKGVWDIPPALRSIGVTVREYEVLQLLAGRLSNREIAARLHLSPRTVEKHVAGLINKTGQPDRIALAEFGSVTSR